jgi:iron-sulfur cluster assembly protein
MEYTMEWAAEKAPFDEVVEQNGAMVLIDPKAVMYLLGSEMDYLTEKLSSQFVFNNPNQTSSCGCGDSVHLASAAAD